MKRLTSAYHDNKVNRLLGGGIVRNPAFKVENDGIITENPGFNKSFQELVIDGLRCEAEGTKAKLQELQEDFRVTAMYRYNILRYGRRGVFMQYLLGLPYTLAVPYKYRDMVNFLVELTGEEKIRDLDDEQVDFFYWAHVEYAIHTLLKEHGLPAMDSLDIID